MKLISTCKELLTSKTWDIGYLRTPMKFVQNFPVLGLLSLTSLMTETEESRSIRPLCENVPWFFSTQTYRIHTKHWQGRFWWSLVSTGRSYSSYSQIINGISEWALPWSRDTPSRERKPALARSSDLAPCDSFLWRYLKTRSRNLKALKVAIVGKITAIPREVTEQVVQNFRLRLTNCINHRSHHILDVIFISKLYVLNYMLHINKFLF